MSRIFISYSSKSKESVRTLAQDLGEIGHQIWFDHKLTGGKEWWDQILEQIRQCDLFVFALTPDALDSIPCQREYRYADALDKNILPVMLADGVSINLLPPELTVIQFVDYREQSKEAAFRLMTALSGLPAARPLPMPLPEAPAVPISYEGELKVQIEAAKTLSFDEQSAILLKLRAKLDEYQQSNNRLDDIHELLRRFKKRDDLFARIDREIESLIHRIESVAPNPAPTVSIRSQFAPAPSLPVSPPPAQTPPISPPPPVYTGINNFQASGQAAARGGVAKVRPATLGWALAGLIASVLSLLPVSGVLFYAFDFTSAFLAGGVAGYFTFRVFKQVFPQFQDELQKRMAIGFALAWLAGAVVGTMVLSEGSALMTRLILHVVEGSIITVTVLGVLQKAVPTMLAQFRRSVMIAWGVGYFIMFVIYSLTEPMLFNFFDRAYNTEGDFTSYIFWSIVVVVIANSVGATVATWLNLRAMEKTEQTQRFAPLPHTG
jgi:hypothetical protein